MAMPAIPCGYAALGLLTDASAMHSITFWDLPRCMNDSARPHSTRSSYGDVFAAALYSRIAPS